MLTPASHQASDIASLWWWMLGAAWVGIAVVVGLLLAAWVRRARRGIGADREGQTPGEKASTRVVVVLGIVVPILVIGTLFFIADVFVIRTTQAPAANATKLTVRVVARQWFWVVRYPGTAAVTANELHIPVRTPVLLQATTADVIHSFWVPALNRKVDTIPGQVNEIELDADHTGVYRGQCAEYCGVEHAHMALDVVVQTPAAFRRWLANMARPARTPTTAAALAGERDFVQGTCASCHTIRGTGATGTTGPDLTHLATRSTLAALTIANTPRNLARWITDNQAIKPGNRMVDFHYRGKRLSDLVAFLDSLR